jgi:hypothetical protein
MARRRWACVFLVAFLAVRTRSDDKDAIVLGNDSGEENGVIAWGTPPEVDNQPRAGSTVPIDNMDSGKWNQVVAFTKSRPPALNDSVTWSSASDSIALDYPAPFEVKLKFWILCGNKNTCAGVSSNKKGKLAGFLVWANERLTAEHVGFTLVRADDDWISDQTGLTGDTPDLLLEFRGKKCDRFDDAVRVIKRENTVNVYIVKSVGGLEGDGWQCRQNYDSAVVGRKAIWGSILHEICHVFALEHSDGKTWFYKVGGDENLMSKRSSGRRYLTEGQVFRMYFDTESGFNQHLDGLDDVLPDEVEALGRPRSCTDSTKPPCPDEDKMLWADH